MPERRASPRRSRRSPSAGRIAVSRAALAERQAALSRAPLFSELPKRHLRLVGRVTWVSEFSEGATVVREGSVEPAFFVILEGRATVVRNGRTVARLSPGDFFGEISLLDPGPRTASVVASSPIRCLTLSGQDFRQILEREPRVASKIAAGLARRLRRQERTVVG